MMPCYLDHLLLILHHSQVTLDIFLSTVLQFVSSRTTTRHRYVFHYCKHLAEKPFQLPG